MSSPEEGTPSPPSPPRPRGRSRRARALVLTIVIVALLVVAFVGFTSFYTDLLWFRSISASSVFARQIWTRVFLFLAFGIVIGVAVVANAVIAYRVRPPFRAMSVEQQALDRYRTALEPFRRIITVLLGLIVGLIAGASASSEWRTYMQWRNSTPFGTKDPQFHVDVSFFAFRLAVLALSGRRRVHGGDPEHPRGAGHALPLRRLAPADARSAHDARPRPCTCRCCLACSCWSRQPRTGWTATSWN